MTYGSEERWDPAVVENGGVPPHSGVIESVFLHPDDLAALDAHLAAKRTRPPMGFIPPQRSSSLHEQIATPAQTS